MKKLSSAELFRIPAKEFYVFIEGEDFYSSGVFTIKKTFFSTKSSLKSKGINFGEDGHVIEGINENGSAVASRYNLYFQDLVDEALKENPILYRLQLSSLTRQGVAYAFYLKGFISVPVKIIEFVLKNLSSQEALMTNGKTVFITKGDEILGMIESCEMPKLDNSEKELIIQLSQEEGVEGE